MKPARLLTIAALLAPRERRVEWLGEWHSELWYVQLSARSEWEILRFCLGAFADAWWVRRARPADQRWIGSPAFCLAAMLAVAAATAVPFARLVLHGGTSRMLANRRGFILDEVLILLSAFAVVLPLAPPGLSRWLEESPHKHGRWARLRDGLFLASKLVLAWSIVFCGTCDAAIYFTALVIPHAAVVGHVLFFLWVLNDQRRRCPVCLRPMASVCRVGKASRTFLERYGSESGCARGHGVMFTPGVVTSYTAAVWKDAAIPDSSLSR